MSRKKTIPGDKAKVGEREAFFIEEITLRSKHSKFGNIPGGRLLNAQ